MAAGVDERVCFVVGAVVLAMNPITPSAISTLTGLEEEEVMNILQLIQSLLKFPDDPDPPVLPFHKSLPDFITDPLRCLNERFHTSPRAGHVKLVLDCLKLMNSSLEWNLLSLPNYALNAKVGNLDKGQTSDYHSTAVCL